MKTTDKPTLTIKGKSSMRDATKAQEDLFVVATITSVAGQSVSPLVPSKAKIVVYNKASEAELNTEDAVLNKDGKWEVTHCNNGTFAIQAVDPQIGKGTWTIVGGTTAGVSIADASKFATTVTGVKPNTHVIVRWSVTNAKCDDLNLVELKLINNDCTDIDVDNTASADLNPSTNEVCVGDNVTYVFTLTNSSGVTSEKINVSVEIPTELLNTTVTADALGSYKNGVWTVPTMKTTDKPTLTIKGKSSMRDATKAQEELLVVATITSVAGQEIKPLVPSTAKIVVYNKASEAKLNTKEAVLNKDGKWEVTHCNNGTFAIEAVDPQIGKGTWTLVEGTTAGVSIEDASQFATTVTGVKEDTYVVVRWSVTNEKCDDLNFVDLKLTNNDCTDIDIDNEASADLEPTTNKVCVGEDVTYVFTLTNSSGVVSENINVSVEIPAELLNATVTADALGSYKNGVWTVSTMKTTDKPTLTIKGKSSMRDATKAQEELLVVATITSVAGQPVSPLVPSTATIVVYNKASKAELNTKEAVLNKDGK
jgi:NaMN:DMB phosphoribosyltransferase